ncbi:hypothetical protein [Reticulibacter mediterranei]|uniref:hypothetical protein n=1 Tax=Reticulibacter mediterranei TaxID=2778369 RepID=UPI001C690BF0|nr:hypothetical protein [Reticulibacter mediterranei]
MEPVSSIKTRSFVGSVRAFARYAARSSSLRSVAPIDFFSCPAQLGDRPAHRPTAHALTIGLLLHGAMLRQRHIGVGL